MEISQPFLEFGNRDLFVLEFWWLLGKREVIFAFFFLLCIGPFVDYAAQISFYSDCVLIAISSALADCAIVMSSHVQMAG